jgi:hypothetical protein
MRHPVCAATKCFNIQCVTLYPPQLNDLTCQDNVKLTLHCSDKHTWDVSTNTPHLSLSLVIVRFRSCSSLLLHEKETFLKVKFPDVLGSTTYCLSRSRNRVFTQTGIPPPLNQGMNMWTDRHGLTLRTVLIPCWSTNYFPKIEKNTLNNDQEVNPLQNQTAQRKYNLK